MRASIHRVDPENTAIRRSVTIRRRVYHVDGPNSLWHVDGNHKLIRWRMVIYGGIDGYSRTVVVFLRCSDNNGLPLFSQCSLVLSRNMDYQSVCRQTLGVKMLISGDAW